MSARRTERLLNLTICLMAGRRPLSKAELRGLITDYRNATSDESFERMFERDKDDLREMGIPLVTEHHDPLFDDEIGYRIDPTAYALPEIEVGPDEMAVLTLAARAWQQAALAPAAAAALRKVEAYASDDLDAAPAENGFEGLGLEPRVSTSEPAFGPLYEAVRDRRPVRFGYRRSGSTETTERHLEPWGVVSWHGRWYVAGHDRDRDATRVFRLSRIEGDVTGDGANGTVVVPDDIDPATVVAMIAPDAPSRDAVLRVRRDAGHALRVLATSVVADGPDHELLTVPFSEAWQFAPDVVASDAVALEPQDLREACVEWLRDILAAERDGLAS